MDGWMDEWMDGWRMDRWMDGWMDKQTNKCIWLDLSDFPIAFTRVFAYSVQLLFGRRDALKQVLNLLVRGNTGVFKIVSFVQNVQYFRIVHAWPFI